MRPIQYPLTAVLLAVALPAFAQQAAPASAALTPDQLFTQADRNKDGKVDRDELAGTLNPDARPYLDAVWRDRDKNGDGWLSKDELTSNTPPNSSARRPPPPQP